MSGMDRTTGNSSSIVQDMTFRICSRLQSGDIMALWGKPERVTGQEWANATAQFVNLVTARRLRWQDAGSLGDDLAWTSRKAHDETGHFTAVRMADDHPIPAALASIRAVWLASGPSASSPRVF